MEDVNEVQVSTEQTPVEVVTETVPQPGEKTDSALLLESLQKERDKRRDLESELAAFKSQQQTEEVVSDEGKALLKKISDLETKLTEGEKQKMWQNIQEKFPVLKDKAQEFTDYQDSNPGMSVETAAKAFLVEHDLMQTPQIRKGLEKTGGGQRQAPQTGLSMEDVEDLRVNNYRKYSDMVRKGQIKFN